MIEPKDSKMTDIHQDVIGTRVGEPEAKLVPCPAADGPRTGGQWHGLVRIATDEAAFGISPE